MLHPPPRVVIGPPRILIGRPRGYAVGDGLTAEQVTAVAQTHLDEIAACFARVPLAKRKRSVMKYTVATTGQTVAATVSESDAPMEVGRCAETSIRRWVFPQPEGEPSRSSTSRFA